MREHDIEAGLLFFFPHRYLDAHWRRSLGRAGRPGGEQQEAFNRREGKPLLLMIDKYGQSPCLHVLYAPYPLSCLNQR